MPKPSFSKDADTSLRQLTHLAHCRFLSTVVNLQYDAADIAFRTKVSCVEPIRRLIERLGKVCKAIHH